MVTSVRQTGRAGAAAGVFMIVGIEGEWLLNPQADDGTVTNLPVFALLMLIATIGFGALVLAVLGLRARGPRTTPARAGALMSLVGAGLLLVFGVTYLVTAVAGSPLEAAFIAFLIGMLLLSVGPITWGLALRKHTPPAGVWQLVALSGAAAFAALALEADPWHDLALVTSYGAWSAVGLLLLRRGTQEPSEPLEHADRA